MFRRILSSVMLANAPNEKYIIHMIKKITPRFSKLKFIQQFNYFHSYF